VYTGRLKDGQEVVVKIRRPNIDQKIKLDLYLMRYVAKRLAREYQEMKAINIVGVVDEFGESIFKELNYYNEATNLLRFREIFKNNPQISIPEVHMKYTTQKMIIMERIFGMPPDNPEQLRSAGLDPEQIAFNGTEAL
ncbi:MAG: AarF/ABC1/UbiB kinase family protein, partial [Odoribacter sp.]|nr:AarF/ABC1/UbiB kinase family protein [Odoribacter sp.]